jgi:regulator of ribonuclease activity A
MTRSTADLSDEFGDRLGYCQTRFHQYGRPRTFAGKITTVRCLDDNALLKSVLGAPGSGGVVVVDGGGSLRSALFGDTMAQLAIDNGWVGVIINGAVRDTATLATMNLGVKALATNPRRGARTGSGEKDIPLAFGGTTFRPGEQIFSDEDGIVVQAL